MKVRQTRGEKKRKREVKEKKRKREKVGLSRVGHEGEPGDCLELKSRHR